MQMNPVKVRICPDEERSWDTIWKWSWITRKVWMREHWEETRAALQPLLSSLPKLRVKSILDCSCGLGFKTVVFAKNGYEVEGSDASATAIKYAPRLAEEEGLKIRFFRSRFEELGKNCKRKYDCVYSDYFDELGAHAALKASAKGVYSVLKKGGKFIFCSFPPDWTKSDLKKQIERVWKRRKQFIVDLLVEQDGLRVTHIEVGNKTSKGILEHHIYLIEEKGKMRAEVASIMNPRVRWTFRDHVEVLKEAGFKKVDGIKREKEEIFIIAIK